MPNNGVMRVTLRKKDGTLIVLDPDKPTSHSIYHSTMLVYEGTYFTYSGVFKLGVEFVESWQPLDVSNVKLWEA